MRDINFWLLSSLNFVDFRENNGIRDTFNLPFQTAK